MTRGARRRLATPTFAAIALAGALGGGCATTIDETAPTDVAPGTVASSTGAAPPAATGDGSSTGSTPAGGSPPAEGSAIAGSTDERLRAIGDELARLSSQIGDDGDERATMSRVDAGWAELRDELERERPELALRLQVAIDLARTAVDRHRPADADKAYRLFTDLLATT